MAIYRHTLIWALRCAAALALAMSAWAYVEARRLYEATAAQNPGEAAGLFQPALSFFLPSVAIALVCLTLSEILALLLRRT